MEKMREETVQGNKKKFAREKILEFMDSRIEHYKSIGDRGRMFGWIIARRKIRCDKNATIGKWLPKNKSIQKQLFVQFQFDYTYLKFIIDKKNDPDLLDQLINVGFNIFKLSHLKEKLVADIKQVTPTYTQPGSITYLINGPQLSNQSIMVKCGRLGENLTKYIIEKSEECCLLDCGVRNISLKDKRKKNKDIDILWLNKRTKTIYYREAKGNFTLDTEKMSATKKKIKEISKYLKREYPDHHIDIGVFHWSIYDRTMLTNHTAHRKCEIEGIKVDHVSEMMNLLGFKWPREDFLAFFRRVSSLISNS